MPYIPAFCDHCGLIFNSGFSFGGNVQNITMSGNKTQCPNCGEMAIIPDGLYNVVNNTIELLKGPEISAQRLKLLKLIITDLRNKELTNQELNNKLTEEIPELSSLKDFLPKTRNELYAFLGLLLAIVTILININSNDDKANITINNVIQNYNQQFVDQREDKKQVKINNSVKQGRNEKCNCGSGLKFKKCCGKMN